MMKKCSFLMLAIATLLASCSQNDELQSTVNDNEGLKPVTISVAMPTEGMTTRATNASGDEEVTRCLIQILDENSQPLEGYETPEEMDGTEAGGFTTTATLSLDGRYSILFWADGGEDYYVADDLTAVSMADGLATPGIAYAASVAWGGAQAPAAVEADLRHVVSKITLRSTTVVSNGKKLSLHVPTTYSGYDILAEEPFAETTNGSTCSKTLQAAVPANSDVFSFYVLADGEENQTLILSNDGAETKIENVPVKPDTHIILQGDVEGAGYTQVTFTTNIESEWGNTETIKENQTAQVSYHIGDMKDLFSLVDITVTYTDENGDTQTETVTSLPWSKELPTVEVPFNPSMTIYYKMKEGVEFNKAEYGLQRSYSINVDTEATVLNNESVDSYDLFAADAAKGYIEQLEEKPDEISCEIKNSKE